jgi:glutamate dehydrogenase/leucine dehydrogenase
MTHFSQLDTIFDATLEATANLERCARFLDLEDWIVLRLRQCEQEITLNTTTTTRPLSALWVRHCTAHGPAAVSLQISRDVTSNSERARAMQSTWMSAIYGLAFGGGAATIILDSSDLNEAALRDAIHRIGASIAEVAGNAVLYPQNLNAIEMAWVHDACHPERSAAVSRGVEGPFVSSPDHYSPGAPHLPQSADVGTTAPDDSIAFGLLELIRAVIRFRAPHLPQSADVGSQLRNLRIAVQGFDATCQSLMHQLHRAGARIVAVADASGGLRDPLGLDPTALAVYEKRSGMLLGYSGAEAIVNSEVLESDCDVLVLASGAHQVGPQNASRIRARVLVEAASQAIAASSKSELSSAGKLIVSDLLCCGLVPLFYCTEADRAQLAASPKPFLRRSVRHMWSQLQHAAARWQLPLHTAAEMLAVQRVAEAIRVKRN